MFKQKKTALYMRFATSQQVRQKTIRNRLRALAMLNKLLRSNISLRTASAE